MIKDNDLQTYTQLMKTRFMEDPGVIFQVKDLERADLLIECQFENQIQAFMEENGVRVLEGGKGLIGYFTKALPEDRLMKVMQQSSQKLLETVSMKRHIPCV